MRSLRWRRRLALRSRKPRCMPSQFGPRYCEGRRRYSTSATNALRYAQFIPGAQLLTVPGNANHFTFGGDCTDEGRRARKRVATAKGTDRTSSRARRATNAGAVRAAKSSLTAAAQRLRESYVIASFRNSSANRIMMSAANTAG